MSPYRVLVIDENDSKQVLVSFRSLDEETGVDHIYIAKRIIKGLDSVENSTNYVKLIAHRVTTKLNSNIVGHYVVDKDISFVGRYKVGRYVKQFSPITYLTEATNIKEYTLQDCVRSCMNDYCSINRLRIIEEL